MRLHVTVLLALIFLPACATTSVERRYIDSNAPSVTLPAPMNRLTYYFTDTACRSLEPYPLKLVCNGIYPKELGGSFVYLEGFDTPVVLMQGQIYHVVDGVTLEEKECFWDYNNRFLLHEYLHAYSAMVLTPYERLRWEMFWKHERQNLPASVVDFIQGHSAPSVYAISPMDDPEEGWAYLGQYIACERTTDGIPKSLLEWYRGILRDEFLNADPQVASH